MRGIIKLILLIVGIFLLIIIFAPNVANKTDEITGTEFSGAISSEVRGFFGGIWSGMHNFIDNPAPNTSKNIDGRNQSTK